MTTEATPTTHVKSRGATFALWAGVIGCPLMWLLHMQVSYVLVPWVCSTQKHFTLHATTILFLALAVLGGVLSWVDYHRAGGGSPEDGDGGPDARTRFLGVVGMSSAVLYALLILGQGIASFYISPCWN